MSTTDSARNDRAQRILTVNHDLNSRTKFLNGVTVFDLRHANHQVRYSVNTASQAVAGTELRR